jgi:hypothetical protein
MQSAYVLAAWALAKEPTFVSDWHLMV